MSYQERLTDSYYKGIKFELISLSVSGGKKGGVKEIPFSDIPNFQDLGNKSQSFAINLLISGDNYDEDRDALISVLTEESPGELKLSGRKPFDALPLSWSYVEKPDIDMGEVTFNITFIPFEYNAFPSVVNSGSSGLLNKIDNNAIALADSYAENINYGTVFLKEAGEGKFLKSLDSIDSSVAELVEPDKILDFKNLKDVIKNTMAKIIDSNPATLAANLVSLIMMPAEITKVIDDVKENVESLFYAASAINSVLLQFDSYLNLIDIEQKSEEKLAPTVEEDIINAKNTMVHKDTVLSGVILALSKATIQTEPKNRDELVNIIERLNETYIQIEATLEDMYKTSEEAVYIDWQCAFNNTASNIYYPKDNLVEIRKSIVTEVTKVLTEKLTTLATKKSYFTTEDTTAINLAYKLLNNPDKEVDILDWNNFNDQYLIPVGTEVVYYD